VVICVDVVGFGGTVSIWKSVVEGLVKKWVVNVGFTAVEVRRIVVSELVKVWIVIEGVVGVWRVKKGMDEVVDVELLLEGVGVLDGTSEVLTVLVNGGPLAVELERETGDGVGGKTTGTTEVTVDELELDIGLFVEETG
jgi:hypothetical protein